MHVPPNHAQKYRLNSFMKRRKKQEMTTTPALEALNRTERFFKGYCRCEPAAGKCAHCMDFLTIRTALTAQSAPMEDDVREAVEYFAKFKMTSEMARHCETLIRAAQQRPEAIRPQMIIRDIVNEMEVWDGLSQLEVISDAQETQIEKLVNSWIEKFPNGIVIVEG